MVSEKTRKRLVIEEVADQIKKSNLNDEQIHAINRRGWIIKLDIPQAEGMSLKSTMIMLSEGELLVASAIADAMTHLEEIRKERSS